MGHLNSTLILNQSYLIIPLSWLWGLLRFSSQPDNTWQVSNLQPHEYKVYKLSLHSPPSTATDPLKTNLWCKHVPLWASKQLDFMLRMLLKVIMADVVLLLSISLQPRAISDGMYRGAMWQARSDNVVARVKSSWKHFELESQIYHSS